MKETLTSIFGANYRTTLTSWAGTLSAALTFISQVSYDTSPLSMIIPPEHKATIAYIAGIATVILWGWNGLLQKDKAVTGGTIVNDPPAKSVAQAKKDDAQDA